MTSGWIRLHRQIEEWEYWLSEPFSRGQAWIDLILLANHKPGVIWVRGNKINLKRGQCGWSITRLTQRWKRSKWWVQNFLCSLESQRQIDQQKNNVSSIITIINYEKYQQDQPQIDPQIDPQTDHRLTRRLTTNKNDKNDKNDKNSNNPPTPLTKDYKNSGREEKMKPLPTHLYPLAVYLLAMETMFVNYDQLRLAINRYIRTSTDLSCYTVPQLCFALWTAMKRQKADPVGYTVHLETIAKCILEANRFEPRGEAKAWCDGIQSKFESQKDTLLTSHSPLICPPKTP